MKRNLNILLLIFCVAFSSRAQKYSERGTPIPTATRMLMHVPTSASISFDGLPVEVNDMIGFFYDSLGTNAVAGLTIWNGFSNDNYIYGDTTIPTAPGAKEGFAENEIMQVKIFDMSEGCVIENGDYVLSSGTVTFRKNTFDTLNAFTGYSSDIIYPQNTFCVGRNDTILPVYVGGVRPVTFTTDIPGLEINDSTGGIVPIASTPGIYKVYFESLSCLNDTVTTITILPATASVNYPTTSVCGFVSDPVTPVISGASGPIVKTLDTGLDLDNTTGTIIPANSTPGIYTIFFDAPQCFEETQITFEIKDADAPISYPVTSICENDTSTIYPIFSGPTPSDLYFKASDDKLSVDSLTGKVNAKKGGAGTYVITLKTKEGCYSDSTIDFTVKKIESSLEYPQFGCQNDLATNLIIPDVITGTFPSNGTFSSSAGLAVNSTTGEVDINNSNKGSYTISLETTVCIPDTAWDITIDSIISITYPATICSGYADSIAPNVIGYIPDNTQFLRVDPDLKINDSTGVIDIINTPVKDYVFFINSDNECILEDQAMIEIVAPKSTIDFASSYCKQDKTVVPVISPGIPSDLMFSTADANLVFTDPMLGVIDLSTSLAGNYTIKASSSTCLNDSTFDIEIIPPAASFEYEQTIYCASEFDSIVPITSPGFPSDADFFSSDPGVIIDQQTGVIDVINSTASITQIYVETSTCLVWDSFDITLSRTPAIILYDDSILCKLNDATADPGSKNGILPPVIYRSSDMGIVIDTSNGEIDLQASMVGKYEIELESDACLADSIISIEISDEQSTVTYPAEIICKDNFEAITPVTTGTFIDLKFSTTDPNISLDTETGEVDVSATQPGIYSVNYEGGICLTTSSVLLEIAEEIPFSRDDIILNYKDCGNATTVDFTSFNTTTGTTYTLYDGTNSIVGSSIGDINFSGLAVDNYELEIITERGCSKSIPKKTKEQDCLTSEISSGDAVITPLTEGPYKQIKIPCEGTIKIYDRNSQLVRTLINNTIWDGKNDNGDFTRSGLYIIFCDDDTRVGEVTVVLE